MPFEIPFFDMDAFVRATLAEDLGPTGKDVTSESGIPADVRFNGVMDSRDAITVAGLPIAVAFFQALDPLMEIDLLVEEGAQVPAGTELMRLKGNARAMLTAERSALNTVQHLSGIATMTRQYVDAIAGTGCTLLDTRKTIPGLRLLEKYATRIGGATNHRMGLWVAAVIKENHVAASQKPSPAPKMQGLNASSLRWTASPKLNLASRLGQAICYSTIWTPICCAKRLRALLGVCRLRHRAG